MGLEQSRGSFLFLMFISLFLAVLGLFLLRGLSLVAESEDYSVAVVCSFLLVAVSLVGEHWV